MKIKIYFCLLLLLGSADTWSQAYSGCVGEKRMLFSSSRSTFYGAKDSCKAMGMRLPETVNNEMRNELEPLVREAKFESLNMSNSVAVWVRK